MVDRPEWYPPGQVYDLKPVVGVPRDDEVIGIHAVIHAANRVSGVPEMHDPDLHMKLVDHLFSVQMARYRSRYSLITFPCDATYTPPALPPPVSVNLEPVSGAPSDEEMKKVQDAIQMYQELRRFPSLFDAHVNMELSQHLFDLQMARYMRLAGESPPNLVPLATATPEIPDRVEERIPTAIDQNTRPTNNAGTGSSTTGVQPTSNVDVRELMERSNQLAERFNQLLERSNELVERCARPSEQPDPQTFCDKFNQVLERIAQAMEQSHRPTELPNRLDEQFCQLFERFNQLFEQSAQPAQKANELAQRSNELADRANQLADRLNQSHEHSNQLSEQANTTWEQVKNVLGNTNKMLMRIQHAIVRNHKGSTINSLDCLTNHEGKTQSDSDILMTGFAGSTKLWSSYSEFRLPVVIDGVSHDTYVYDSLLGGLLQFYGIGDELCQSATSVLLKDGLEDAARRRLGTYLSLCLG